MDSSFSRTVIPPKLVAVSAGIVYAGSSGVYAIDASTGSVLRHYRVSHAFDYSVHGNVLYASWQVDGGGVAAIGLDGGAELWRAAMNGRPTAALAVADGLTFACTVEGDVLAFDARDGTLVWNEALQPIMFYGPVVADGTLIVALAANAPDVPRLYALDAHTGRQKWNASLNELTMQPLVIHAGVIYVCGHHSCAAFRANDGAPLWFQPLDGDPTSGGVLLGTTLYLTEEETRLEWSADAEEHRHLSIPALTALDAASGERLWRHTLSDGESPPRRLTAPACDSNHILFGADDGVLRSVRSDENQVWRFESGGAWLSAPLISADEATVYVGSNDGYVHALDTSTGTLKWSAMTDTSRYSVVGVEILSSWRTEFAPGDGE